MLCVILDRALPLGDEYDETFDWFGKAHNYLEEVLNDEKTTDQNEIEKEITLFKKDLMVLCVNLLYRLPASEKVRFDLKWCMTADEMVKRGLSNRILVCRQRTVDEALDS